MNVTIEGLLFVEVVQTFAFAVFLWALYNRIRELENEPRYLPPEADE